jgi:hypothetical protein
LLAIYNFCSDLNFEHWDVKQAFVNAPLKETIYCLQVPGFEREGTQKKVLKLRKALYGTKQAANAWQQFLSKILTELGGKRNLKDECVYIFREGEAFLIIGTHVDDIFPLFNKQGKKLRDKVFSKLGEKMEIENKGEIKFALDMKIETDRQKGILKISQESYIDSHIKEYRMEEAVGKDTPGPLTESKDTETPKTKVRKREWRNCRLEI